MIKNLEECLWYDIKKAKTGFVPNHVKLRKEDGKIARSDERPEVLADYYDHKQWAKPTNTPINKSTIKIFNYTSNVNTNEITRDELYNILKRMKNAKTPGPDGIPIEFFKWLREDTPHCKTVADHVICLLN